MKLLSIFAIYYAIIHYYLALLFMNFIHQIISQIKYSIFVLFLLHKNECLLITKYLFLNTRFNYMQITY